MEAFLFLVVPHGWCGACLRFVVGGFLYVVFLDNCQGVSWGLFAFCGLWFFWVKVRVCWKGWFCGENGVLGMFDRAFVGGLLKV